MQSRSKFRPVGVTLWSSRLRHCTTSQKVAGSIPDGVIGIFHWHIPSFRTMDLGSTKLLTEISTRNISWGVKAAGAYGWQSYHLNVPVLFKSESLNLLETWEPSQVYAGIALPLPFTVNGLALFVHASYILKVSRIVFTAVRCIGIFRTASEPMNSCYILDSLLNSVFTNIMKAGQIIKVMLNIAYTLRRQNTLLQSLLALFLFILVARNFWRYPSRPP
jgi:hypothetical protein